MSRQVLSHWIGAALLAVAVSLDGFAAGVAYGLRRITLPAGALWLTGIPSGLVVLVLGSAGAFLSHAVGFTTARFVGGLVLVALGLRSFFETRRSLKRPESAPDAQSDEGPTAEPMTVWTIRIPSFGLVLQVLREPTRADLDRSGGISLAEALLLGIALAMDAGGAGLGAGMTGLIPWAAAIAVTLADVGFLHLGISTGRLLAGRANRVAAITGLLPSVILVGMGIARLLP